MLETMTKRMEEKASAWWDKTLRHPKTLTGLGWTLRGVSAWKAAYDRWLELTWSSARLPSALDVERVYERLGELEDVIHRLEDRLEDRLEEQNNARN